MKNNKTIGYKAFKKGLICKGKQYEENTVYKEHGNEICNAGVMHYCKNPFNVLNFYPLVTDNCNITEFAEVEPLGDVYRCGTKSATNKMRIKTKLELDGFIDACINFAKYIDVCESEEDTARIISKDYSNIVSTRSNEHITIYGSGIEITSSGDNAHIASSGDSVQIISNEYGARIASSGNNAQIASNGHGARIVSGGKYSTVVATGYDSIAKAKIGSWITLGEWCKGKKEYDDCTVCYLKRVKTEYVDGKCIK